MRITLSAAVPVLAALQLVSAVSATENGSVGGTVSAKGLRTSADIVVSLEAPGLKAVPPAAPIEMDQKGMLFIPHVLPVVRGTTVRFLNSDALPHNVFSPEGRYNLGTWPQGETKDRKFEKPGAYTQLCRVHPEMEAYVIVLDTPYFATTDKTGAFEIKNVPAGQYMLVAWSEKLKTAKQAVTVEAGRPVSISLTLTR
jgi:plastocyanin